MLVVTCATLWLYMEATITASFNADQIPRPAKANRAKGNGNYRRSQLSPTASTEQVSERKRRRHRANKSTKQKISIRGLMRNIVMLQEYREVKRRRRQPGVCRRARDPTGTMYKSGSLCYFILQFQAMKIVKILFSGIYICFNL